MKILIAVFLKLEKISKNWKQYDVSNNILSRFRNLKVIRRQKVRRKKKKVVEAKLKRPLRQAIKTVRYCIHTHLTIKTERRGRRMRKYQHDINRHLKF